MNSFGYSDILTRFSACPRSQLKFLTQQLHIDGLFAEEPQEPENISQYLYDPNDFYIEPKSESKKKGKEESRQILLIGKSEEKKQSQQKKKNYKPGPFALFYEINQGKLQKDELVWYYKEHKDIVGPVSSYNMDKMVFYKQVTDETRVAFKSIDKFVKFSKIKKIVEQQRKQEATN